MNDEPTPDYVDTSKKYPVMPDPEGEGLSRMLKWLAKVFVAQMFHIVVVVLLGLGLIHYALTGCPRGAPRTKAESQAVMLETAISNYCEMFGEMPTKCVGGLSSDEYQALVDRLAGKNERDILFLSVRDDGSYLDPWENQFKVEIGEGNEVRVWSVGPDGKDETPEDKEDNIKPWDD